MVTLDELLNDTGINRNTLAKYRDLGLIPKPTIVHRGYKKEGQPRGNEALYPSYTPWLIKEIERLKASPYRYSLSQIRDEIGKIEDITPEGEISEPLEAADINGITKATVAIGARLEELTAGYKRVLVEYETDEKEGKLKVASVWGIQKKLEAKGSQ
jgi:hypothetical protein